MVRCFQSSAKWSAPLGSRTTTQRSALVEAVAQLTRALDQITSLPANPQVRRDQIRLTDRPEDPLLLFSVLYGFWVHNYVTCNGDVMRELAFHFLALAEKQTSTALLMIEHRLMGLSLMTTGDIVGSLPHYNRGIALYDPVERRPLAARFAFARCVFIAEHGIDGIAIEPACAIASSR
jgi:hypothetical protein